MACECRLIGCHVCVRRGPRRGQRLRVEGPGPDVCLNRETIMVGSGRARTRKSFRAHHSIASAFQKGGYWQHFHIVVSRSIHTCHVNRAQFLRTVCLGKVSFLFRLHFPRREGRQKAHVRHSSGGSARGSSEVVISKGQGAHDSWITPHTILDRCGLGTTQLRLKIL